MSDKDQFTFEDEEDNPESGVSKKTEPQETDSFDGEVFFDTEEDLPGNNLGDQAGPEASEHGSEEFFFDTENDDSESTQDEKFNRSEPEAGEVGFAVDEDLFGDNLNAGFPDDESATDDAVDFTPEPKAKSGAGSKKRTLLMVLLLLIVAAGGAYYFMGLGSSTPSVPTVQVPVEKPVKTVTVPPPPAEKSPAEQAVAAKDTAVTKDTSVRVAVPPPPAPVAAEADVKPVVADTSSAPAGESKPAAGQQPEANAASPVSKSGAVSVPVPVSTSAPAPAQQATSVVEGAASAKPPETPAVKTMAAAKTEQTSKPVAAPEQDADGAYELDAGSYLLESNRDALVAKIKKLGYEASVTPVDARIDMTRLRLGTYSKEDVQASLAFARQIEPGSYSVPAGDGYVIYAGTFFKTDNLKKIKERFLAEGVQVKSEPVEVVRTLSRVRFGRFATREDAAAVAGVVAEEGLKAVVVKAK